MPRKSRAKQPESPAGQPAVASLKEQTGLQVAAELEPPVREVIEPAQQPRPRETPRNGKEYPSFDEKLAQMQAKARSSRRLDGTERPFVDRVGPPSRPRTVEERGDMAPDSFSSRTLTIDKVGDDWQLRSKKELTGEQKDFIARNGLTPADDEEKVFYGTQAQINRANGDINAVAYQVGKGR